MIKKLYERIQCELSEAMGYWHLAQNSEDSNVHDVFKTIGLQELNHTDMLLSAFNKSFETHLKDSKNTLAEELFSVMFDNVRNTIADYKEKYSLI